jgi:hypothetical protein
MRFRRVQRGHELCQLFLVKGRDGLAASLLLLAAAAAASTALVILHGLTGMVLKDGHTQAKSNRARLTAVLEISLGGSTY